MVTLTSTSGTQGVKALAGEQSCMLTGLVTKGNNFSKCLFIQDYEVIPKHLLLKEKKLFLRELTLSLKS